MIVYNGDIPSDIINIIKDGLPYSYISADEQYKMYDTDMLFYLLDDNNVDISDYDDELLESDYIEINMMELRDGIYL